MIWPDESRGMWIAPQDSPRPVISEYERHRHAIMSVIKARHRLGCYDWLESIEHEWDVRTAEMDQTEKEALQQSWLTDYRICLSVMRQTAYFNFLGPDEVLAYIPL